MDLRKVTSVVVLVTVAAAIIYLGPSIIGDGPGGEIRNVSVNATVADEMGIETGPDGTRSCTTVGPPPGTVSVRFNGVVDDRDTDRYATSVTYRVLVEINGERSGKEVTVTDGFSEVVGHVVILENNGIEPGEEVTANVSLLTGGDTVDSVRRTVTVEGRDLRCVETGGK